MSKIIKIALGDDMRRKTYQNISFDDFVIDVKDTFNIPNDSIIIKFQDKIIDSEEQFLYILNTTQTTIKFDIQKRSYDDLYVQEEIKVKEVPKQQIPEVKNNNNNQVPSNPNPNPRMSSNIMQTLFGKMPEQQQQPNPLSMIMGFLPGLMGGNNNNNNGGIGGMFPALFQNLPNIMKILTENLPKEKLQELIVSILKSIPREQLISILRTALSSPQVQESIISTLMSSLDKMVENPSESPKEVPKENTNNQVEEQRKREEEIQRQDELRKQEETRKRIEELKRQQEELKLKQELDLKRKQEESEKQRLEEQKRIDEEDKKKKLEEFIKQQENLKKQYEEQRKVEEEKKKEEERKLYEQLMREQEERKKMIEEEDRKKQEEERKRLEEEEKKRQEQERLRLEQEKKRQEEENLKKQEENKRNQILNVLQVNGIPYECYKNAEELGLIESYGLEKVAQLLIKYKGNVELVANELFN